jgi:hypothetical protein
MITGTLPQRPVKSCQKFFDSLKQQAPSSEPQASSNEQQTERKKMLEIFIIFTSLFILNMLGVFTVTI